VSYKKQIAFLTVSVLICAAFIFSIFSDVKKSAVQAMNERQMIYARLAAQGIEAVLDHHIETLQVLAHNAHIIRMDKDGKDYLRSAQKISTKYIKGLTRLNAQGKIIYTLPAVAGTIGKDISGQAHVREVLRTHKPVISNIFMAVQGFNAVAIHMPVQKGETFDGTIAFLISFNELAKDYLDDLYIKNYRHAQLINAHGKIIYCTNHDYLGRLALELYQDNPAVITMISKMMKGEEGSATYTGNHDENGRGAEQKHTVYTPIRVGNSFWSIALISSDRLLLPSTGNLRKQIILLALILLFVFAIIVYAAARLRSASVEAQKRRQIEDDLIKSAEEVHDLYNNAPCGYHSLDKDGLIVRMNDTEISWLGYSREEIIGKPFTNFLSDEGRRIFNLTFPRFKEQGTVKEVAYDMVRKDRSTFPILINATAVKDEAGNFVMSRSMVLDLTTRKQAEDRLRESENLYRTALETTNDGITIIDAKEGIYLYVNQRLLNTIGRPDENLIGKPIGIYTHPDDRGLGKKYLIAKRKGRHYAANYELRAVKPDGSIVILNVTAIEIIYQGKPAVISFMLDITEQKRAEDALRESETIYRTALENTNDGISIAQNGRYVYLNKKFLNTIGRPDENLIGTLVGSYMHPDDRIHIQKNREARMRGEPAPFKKYDARVIKPDNSIAITNVTNLDITYGGKPSVMTFLLDVTAQKKTEAALRQSEEKYRTIIENIDDDYFETDLAGNIIFFNKPYSSAGYSREELLQSNNRQYTAPEMAKKIYREFNKIYRQGNPARIMDYEITRKDGKTAHLEMSVSLMRNAEGKPAGFRCLVRDVTERIRMEEEKKKLTAQLYQAQKMEAIGTLAGGIAHDFNNLLMGIQGYSSIMLLETDAAHPHYNQFKAIQTLVQSGADLTKQLLGFARGGRYEVVPTRLNDLMAKTINLFGRTRKEISIYEKYASDLWIAEVDRGQIEQVLLNLFVNAWQAMPGGGSLYLETENQIMDKDSAASYDLKPGRYVKLSVMDTGVGMDENTRLRIFDPFFTTKEMGRGTGLGLASAYGIIKGHSGMIDVGSVKGQGATFSIYLPASSREEADAEQILRNPVRGEETILLVDDEEFIIEVTGRLLEELGYHVLTAADGDEAVKIYSQQHTGIDLVIMDMIMPGLSGSETFDKLKSINPAVRVILSSGYSINEKAAEIMQRGVLFFLQKPYHLDELSLKVREALKD
jgi:two-component system cell cycle sensor histidine kinase/response regulator CckA